MPDLERVLRDLELELARNEAARERIRSAHLALDKRRLLIVAVVAVVALIVISVELIAALR